MAGRTVRIGSVLVMAAAVTCGLFVPPAVRARDDLADVLDALRDEDDPEVRRAKVLDLVALGTPKAAHHVGAIARNDPAETVRLEAARGLGRMECDTSEILLELIVAGGTLNVRDALARSLAQRGTGFQPLLDVIADADRHVLERCLAIEALASFDGPEAQGVLDKLARHDVPFVRIVAMRALARHVDGRVGLGESLRTSLDRHLDDDTVLTALDLAADIADPRFAPVVEILDSFLSPRVAAAVGLARRRLDYALALDRFRKEKVGEYGSKTPPEPPPPPARLDVVYVLDSTGSVTGHIGLLRKHVQEEARILDRVGTDLRAGVVAYRDNERRWSGEMIEALPLTYDRATVDDFLRQIDARGTDARGTAVHRGLTAALDRMPWRRGVQRQLVLIADGRCNKPDIAQDITRKHFASDRTTIHVLYLLRTRVRIPDDIRELAKVGGGYVEVLEE